MPRPMRLWPWFATVAAYLIVGGVAFYMLAAGQGWSKDQWLHQPAETFARTSAAVKLLGFCLYLSLCCTFLPLPTGWIVAAVATRQAAVTGELYLTVLLVALTGAIGSTIANLTDYHLFTLLLRYRRIAAVRQTKTYQAAARWFSRGPFFIVTLFNVIPIPVDVIRMLATTYRYGRLPFALANFVGRFLRYAVIAFVTYYWNLGWVAVVALLALAAAMGAWRMSMKLWQKVNPGKN